jgi:hypothetical protein
VSGAADDGARTSDQGTAPAEPPLQIWQADFDLAQGNDVSIDTK